MQRRAATSKHLIRNLALAPVTHLNSTLISMKTNCKKSWNLIQHL